MVAHSALTGADLHEPKGADTASVNTVYVSDGAGSGTWQKVASGQIDSSVRGLNQRRYVVRMESATTAQDVLIPITETCTLTKITGVLSGAITTANLVITSSKNGSSTNGTLTFTQSGSAKGDTVTLSSISAATFADGDYLQLSSAAGSGGGRDVTFMIEFTF